MRRENISKSEFNQGKVNTHIHEKIKGHISCMCPKCFNVYDIKINYELYTLSKTDDHICISLKVNGICKECNTYTNMIILDGNIAKTISILNKKGYTTRFCCEGHKEYTDCYIYFSNNVYQYIEKMNIPDSWYIDEEDYHNNMCIIRSKENIGINKRINDIENWAENLPDITNVIFGYLFVKEGINV